MKTPTIHLNGTSRDGLLDPIKDAITAIIEAEAKVAATIPNGRDYYPQGDDALRVARSEHAARMDKLRQVRHELEIIGVAIADA